MSYNPTHPTTRQSILPSAHTSLSQQSTHSSALQARIAAKRAELANLRQLRDLSAQMATQMQALEDKVATLRDGTEAVSCILANWENVMRAIGMASTKAADVGQRNGEAADQEAHREGDLPVTLVRIPVTGGEEGAG